MTYRSVDDHRFDTIFKQITELKKEVTKREQQKKEMADVIEQDTLIEMKGRRPLKLPEVFVRPATDGKRLPGEVEIHQNGIRYQSMGSSKIGMFRTAILFTVIETLVYRSTLLEHKTSLLPTLRPRTVGDYSRTPEVTNHDRKEEG